MVDREQAEGGSGERCGPLRTHLLNQLYRSALRLSSWWTSKGRGRLVVPRPRKHRRDEERIGVLVSVANEGQQDAVSRGRGMTSDRGLSGVVASVRCSASPPGCQLLVETVEQLRDVGAILPAPMWADRRNQRSSRFVA